MGNVCLSDPTDDIRVEVIRDCLVDMVAAEVTAEGYRAVLMRMHWTRYPSPTCRNDCGSVDPEWVTEDRGPFRATRAEAEADAKNIISKLEDVA